MQLEYNCSSDFLINFRSLNIIYEKVFWAWRYLHIHKIYKYWLKIKMYVMAYLLNSLHLHQNIYGIQSPRGKLVNLLRNWSSNSLSNLQRIDTSTKLWMITHKMPIGIYVCQLTYLYIYLPIHYAFIYIICNVTGSNFSRYSNLCLNKWSYLYVNRVSWLVHITPATS